mmetsp:Transcript_146416/g.355380  ORF Transcript_146416/g.355380 Transcript_146416/m.355380 type:complete len:266 (-) Transcript_146416:127-924(-)
MRGRRPARSEKSSTAATVASNSASASPASAQAPAYAPCTTWLRGSCSPHTLPSAAEISPTVQRARAASTDSLSRFCGWSPSDVLSDSAALTRSASSAASAAASSRLALTSAMCLICASRTALLSMERTSTSSSCSRRYLFTPTITSCVESMRPCFMAAASSMRSLAAPDSMNAAMPPASVTSSMRAMASLHSSSVSDSMRYEPPHGSATFVMPVSSWMMSCVLRAMRELNSVGSASASSNELVCSDCVPPITAAIASTAVRTTLL